MNTITADISAVDWSQYPTPQAIVTSPPYWAKRRYPIPDQWFGGSVGCEHTPVEVVPPPLAPGGNVRGDQGGLADGVLKPEMYTPRPSAFCSCGGWLGQLGQEPTPQIFVDHLAAILTGLPLVTDGVLWVNIDDTWVRGQRTATSASPASHLKAKDLALVPERLALAMQALGWWVRSRVVWYKTNAMPQSTKDRPPHQYETIWQFTKSKHYKYRTKALQVPCADGSPARLLRGRTDQHKYLRVVEQKNQGINQPRLNAPGGTAAPAAHHRPLRDVWKMSTAGSGQAHIAPMPIELAKRCVLLSTDPGDLVLDPFGGTGTTVRAALELGRRGLAVDIDPRLRAWSGAIQQGFSL